MSNEFLTASLRRPRERFIFKEEIGSGSYGKVFRVEWKDVNGKVTIVAAKRIHEEFLKYGQDVLNHFTEELSKEWEILRKLDHPNIIKIYKMRFNTPVPTIFMELMHCDLGNYIKGSTSDPKVHPDKVVAIALGVAKGLEYLHGQTPSVVHRDLASKNILLTEDGQPKIADLGLAKVFPSGIDELATPGPCTPLYAARETRQVVQSGRAIYGTSIDIFSFGVVLLEMSVGGLEPLVVPSGVKVSEVRRRQNDIDKMEDGKLKELVIKCLQNKSSSRPTASKLVAELEKIKDARERLRAQQAATFEKLGKKPAAHDYHFKVLLLGNRNVGKSSLFELLRNPVFDIDKSKMKVTLVIKPEVHYFEYNNIIVKMGLVDTAGEEEYFSLTSSYYRNVDGVFLVYDVSDKVSLQSLPFWIECLRKYNSKENLQMLLVGNKVDLRQIADPDDLVPQENAVEYSNNIKSPYVETSARDIDSVTAMHKKMVEILLNTVSPEDVNVQVTEEARTTIRLPSSPSRNNSQRRRKCSACRKE